jgi:hypothetical protein
VKKIYLLKNLDRLLHSGLTTFLSILLILGATYAMANDLGLIGRTSAEQSCPASLTSGVINSQITLIPDSSDGIIDCTDYDIVVGPTGEVLIDRFVTDTNTVVGDWGVTLKARSLTVHSGGKVTADGKGYLVTEYEAPNGEPLAPLGATGGSGGGHGGSGGEGLSDGINNPTTPGTSYGSSEAPSTLGSAGGNSGDGGLGGAGGGAIKILATETVIVDGIISANGLNGTKGIQSSGGGGAGGSIWIVTGTLSGSGLIEARGGTSDSTATYPGGGGGGGRVIIFSTVSNSFDGTANANPGVPSLAQAGGTGTILGPTSLPSAPTILKQFKSDGSTLIPVGESTIENTIIFATNLADPDINDTLTLQIEVRPLGTAFTGIATHTQASGFANPQNCIGGTSADCGRITVTNMTRSTEYHWQARVRDNKGGASNWISFGENPEDQRDALVTGSPTAITLISGDSQSGTVGTELAEPLVVKITDAGGFPVSGYSVNWVTTVTSSGGQVQLGSSTVTNTEGLASNTYKLGTIDGINTIEARADGLTGTPITFNALGTAGALDHFVITAPQVALVGQSFDAVTITAKDQYENLITNYSGSPTLTAVSHVAPYLPLTGTLTPSTVTFSSAAAITVNNITYSQPESIKIQVADGTATGISNVVAVVTNIGTCPDSDGIIDTNQTWTATTENQGIFDCSGLTIQVNTGAILTLVSYDSGDTNYANDFGTTVLAANVIVNSGGSITADGKGYAINRGPGFGGVDKGSSYGGFGRYNTINPYGSVYEPTDLGSGSRYTAGGGSIKLIVSDTITNNGTISSNGPTHLVSHTETGSGGSIWIDTSTLQGDGIISAKGGDEIAKGGDPGSGGRIAIYYSTDNSSILESLGTGTPKIYAYGGFAPTGDGYVARRAGSGTVYVEQK